MLTRRRLLLTTALAGTTAAAYPIFVEPRWLELTHTSVRLTPHVRNTIRLLQLTDLHASSVVPMSLIESAIKIGLAQQPDLCCLTGDFITLQSGFDTRAYISVLRKLSAYRPTFAVLGNHDAGVWAENRQGYSGHFAVERLLEEAGITLLHNQPRALQIRGIELTLVGLGDLWSNELDPHLAFRTCLRKGPVILLSHNPDSKDLLQPFDWDLMLCGHTHGGQVIVPFQGPRFAPVRDKRFVAGLHPWQGRQIYVSRGVGNLGSVRLLCRPEVTVLDVSVS